MSDNQIIKLVPNFVDKSLEAPAREIGNLLGNIFYAVFNPINFPMEKLRIRKAIELEQYEEDIRIELSKVSEENLIEPEFNIVGPALDASKHYISNEYHRKMFAKLIARSMDKEKTKEVHPSFVEIIKQLSPNDAKLFNDLFKESSIQMPKIKLRIEVDPSDSTGTTLFSTVLPPKFYNDCFSYLDGIRCLENLERLNLIKISDGEIKFNDLTLRLGRTETYEDVINGITFNPLPYHPNPELKYHHNIKGAIVKTEFGNMFYTSVL